MNQRPSLPTNSYGSDPTQLIFKTKISPGSLYLLSHVLFPSPHKPDISRYRLCPCSQLIYGPAGHLRHYSVSSTLYIILDWPYPRGIQSLGHQGPLSLSACHMPIVPLCTVSYWTSRKQGVKLYRGVRPQQRINNTLLLRIDCLMM